MLSKDEADGLKTALKVWAMNRLSAADMSAETVGERLEKLMMAVDRESEATPVKAKNFIVQLHAASAMPIKLAACPFCASALIQKPEDETGMALKCVGCFAEMHVEVG